MPRLLFTVDHVCDILGHGIALFPGIIPVSKERFRVGTTVVLRRGDGSELKVNIAGLELGTPNPRFEVIPLLKINNDEVPIGTQVWSSAEGEMT